MTAVREREPAIRWLAAGVCLGRVARPSSSGLRRIGPWLLAALGERPRLPPAGVIADVGDLLAGEPLGRPAPVPAAAVPDDGRLERAVRRYEEQLLARLTGDRRFEAAFQGGAKLPGELRAQAVGVVAGAGHGGAGEAEGVAIAPGVARRIAEHPGDDLLAQGFAALREDGATRRRIAQAYEALAEHARRAPALLADADVFTLENLTLLGSLTQRLAIRQVLDAEEALRRGMPKRLGRSRRSAGSTATRLEDESEYPAGGFSSLSTSGALENLVTSELVYMDPPSPTRTVDLFDVRYAEGELLYYTRDEATFVRRRRLVVFLFDEDLVAARFKDPDVPWQRLVVILGVMMAAIAALVEHLGDEALAFRVAFLRDPARPSELAPERGLCELLLREQRELGTAEVVESTLAQELASASAESRRALVQIVPVSQHDRREEWSARKLDRKVELTSVVAEGRSWQAWTQATIDLVRALL